MGDLLLASGLVMLASLGGVVFAGWRFGALLSRHLDFLVSFSAGVFVVFAFGLATETIEHTGSLAVGLGWIFAGAILIWLTVQFLPQLHTHGHGHDHGSEVHAHLDPRRMIVSDAVHNAADGIFLAATFAVAPAMGYAATISVFVHEFLQEIAEFFVLRDGGYSVRKALTVNLATASTVLLGAVGGYFLLDLIEALEAPLLGITAGGVLVVVLHDLIPHSVRDSISPLHFAKHIICFVVGIMLMLCVGALLPHEEPEHADNERDHIEEPVASRFIPR